MSKIEIIDGEKYYIIECPNCKNELRFKMHEEKRRIHFACAKCGKEMVIEVDKK